MSILQTVDLKKYYQQGETVTTALDGVSLEINAGEFVSVVGTSGSGKSTLLHMMGGLDSPTSGKVIINGEDISQKSAEQLTVFRRRHIGFVFQNYNLVPVLNVYENIVLPVQLDGKKVSIAGALLTKPEIILADEPTGNLDSKTSQDVLSLLEVTSMKFHQTMVMITHNDAIAQLADRIIRIEDGKITN